jgi:hypothetical protein
VIRDDESSERFIEATENGINVNVFGNPEAVAVWSYIDFYFKRSDRYGHIPSEEFLLETFSTLELPSPQECFEDLCSLVKARWQRRKTEAAWETYRIDLKIDQRAALTSLSNTLIALQEQQNTNGDISFSDVALNEFIADMENLETAKGITGIPFPWPRLNEATGGIQQGDYILIYALPKSMKTWVGLYLAVHVALTGRKVLVYSREMTWETTRRRIGCILAQVDYTKFKKNLLTPAKKVEVLDAVEWFCTECEGDIQFTNIERPDGSAGGPDEVRRKIEIYKPQLVLLDSAYMLELPNAHVNPYDWKSLAVINRRCKQICKKTGVPTIAILQENERAAHKYKNTRGTASLAMNTSAIMDCDLSIRVVYRSDLEEMSLHLPAARETREKGFTIHAKAAYNFGYAHDRLWEVGDENSEGEDPGVARSGQATLKAATAKLPSMASSYRGTTSTGEPSEQSSTG